MVRQKNIKLRHCNKKTTATYYNLRGITKELFREMKWVGPYFVEKVLPKGEVNSPEKVTNRIQTLDRIRLRKLTTDTLLEGTHTNEIFRLDHIVNPEMI